MKYYNFLAEMNFYKAGQTARGALDQAVQWVMTLSKNQGRKMTSKEAKQLVRQNYARILGNLRPSDFSGSQIGQRIAEELVKLNTSVHQHAATAFNAGTQALRRLGTKSSAAIEALERTYGQGAVQKLAEIQNNLATNPAKAHSLAAELLSFIRKSGKNSSAEIKQIEKELSAICKTPKQLSGYVKGLASGTRPTGSSPELIRAAGTRGRDVAAAEQQAIDAVIANHGAMTGEHSDIVQAIINAQRRSAQAAAGDRGTAQNMVQLASEKPGVLRRIANWFTGKKDLNVIDGNL